MLLLICLLAVTSTSGLSIPEGFDNQHVILTWEKSYTVMLVEYIQKNLKCFQSFDKSLTSKWEAELRLKDQENFPVYHPEKVTKVKYNTIEQEWLLEDAMPIKKLDLCIRNLTEAMEHILDDETKTCMKDVIEGITKDDNYFEYTTQLLYNETVPLAFRKILNFHEIFELLQPNRTTGIYNPMEMKMFSEAANLLSSEEDKVNKAFILEQACEWKNLKALREKESEEDMFKEFKTQVRKSVSLKLSHEVLHRWNLDADMSNYDMWMNTRLNNLVELDERIGSLKEQNETAERLCELVTELATNFSKNEEDILLPNGDFVLHLDSYDSRILNNAMKTNASVLDGTTHDIEFRRFSNSHIEGAKCMKTYATAMTNQYRYLISSRFVDGTPYTNLHQSTYFEIFCKKNAVPGFLVLRYCKCIGSTCITRDVGQVQSYQYRLKNGLNAVEKLLQGSVMHPEELLP